MSEGKQPTAPALQAVAQAAAKLSPREQRELISILQALLEAQGKAKLEREERKQAALERRGSKGGKGFIEEKSIRGYGPYRYLRYWYGRTHKSLYLGKTEQ